MKFDGIERFFISCFDLIIRLQIRRSDGKTHRVQWFGAKESILWFSSDSAFQFKSVVECFLSTFWYCSLFDFSYESILCVFGCCLWCERGWFEVRAWICWDRLSWIELTRRIISQLNDGDHLSLDFPLIFHAYKPNEYHKI